MPEGAEQINSPEPRNHRRRAAAWVLPLGVSVGLMWLFYLPLRVEVLGEQVWGVCDDIYISACFARTLAEGEGALWYPGAPRVEGVSNPLWVAVLAGVHRLPGFAEARLGLFVMLIQMGILAGIWALLWRLVRRGMGGEPGRPWLVAGVASFGWSMSYWMACGFEVGLVVLFVLGGFAVASAREPGVRHGIGLGVLTGLAFWTRMDGVVYMAGAWLTTLMNVWGGREGREKRMLGVLGPASAVSLAMAGALLGGRLWYYGDWFPNTYYLKLDGWALVDRVRHALTNLGWVALPSVLLGWEVLAVRQARERLKEALPLIVGGMATFTLSALYSIHNGGDAWYLMVGCDRYTSIGQMGLLMALAIGVGRLLDSDWGRRRGGALKIVGAGIVIGILPIVLDPQSLSLLHSVTRDQQRMEAVLIGDGMRLKAISRPGARIGLREAGTIIYFSRRGGVDLLGKAGDWVAHQPVNDFRQSSGHNKIYLRELIHRERPDFLTWSPGKENEGDYALVKREGRIYWVRKDSPYANWDEMERL